jgi:hypothetical protein
VAKVWPAAFLSALVILGVGSMFPLRREQPAVRFPPPTPDTAYPKKWRTAAFRDDAFRRMRVWRPPQRTVDLGRNPPDDNGTLSAPIVRCQFLPRDIGGTTPKFDCALPDGEVVKVKYGHNAEIHAELAGTRLLSALGFATDQMFLVPRLRCYGCPRFPYELFWTLDRIGGRDIFVRGLRPDRYVDFEWVAVERRFDGIEIATDEVEGWAWYELDRVDPSAGSSRAEIDALRLAAVLLVHWDNKSSNQRLLCAPPIGNGDEDSCAHPVGIVHDLGSTFGPTKVNLDRWRAARIWVDSRQCTVSMRPLPYNGGTFPDRHISEAGRSLLARELAALDDAALTALFTAARFPEFHDSHAREADPSVWAAALRDKATQIATAGPCPAAH